MKTIEKKLKRNWKELKPSLRNFLNSSKTFGFLAEKFESARMGSGRVSGREEVSLFINGKKVVFQQWKANSNTFHVVQAW